MMLTKDLESCLKAANSWESEPSESTAYRLMNAAQCFMRKAEDIYRSETGKPALVREKKREIDESIYPVTMEETVDWYVLDIPPLLNKKRGKTVSPTLSERIEFQACKHNVIRQSGRLVCFVNFVHESGTVQDYDNLDTSAVLNILAETFLSDDNYFSYTLIQTLKIIPGDTPEHCEVWISKTQHPIP